MSFEGMLAGNLSPEERSKASVSPDLQRLLALVGTWEGRGHGKFPTIDPFEYGEILEFRHRAGTPYITYEQTTHLIDTEGNSIEPSHWEAGIIRPQEDGLIVLSSTHDSLRVEVLEGHIDHSSAMDQIFSLKLQSRFYGNDPRMAGSSREFFLNGNELSYRMSMATQQTPMTTAVPDLTPHLEAKLKRQ